MRRWKCPECGDGCLAPERPRTNDVRRYCLPCSEESGRLVERVCPALEKERAARYQRQQERQAKKREKERKKWTINGVRLDLELKKISKAAGLGRVPKLTIHRSRDPWARRTAGHYKPWNGSIHVTIKEGVATRGEILGLLVHEVAHARYAGHTKKFWKHFVALAEKTYKVAPAVDYGWAGWKIQEAVKAAIDEKEEV